MDVSRRPPFSRLQAEMAEAETCGCAPHNAVKHCSDLILWRIKWNLGFLWGSPRDGESCRAVRHLWLPTYPLRFLALSYGGNSSERPARAVGNCFGQAGLSRLRFLLAQRRAVYRLKESFPQKHGHGTEIVCHLLGL